MVPTLTTIAAGGHTGARRLACVAAWAIVAATLHAGTGDDIKVREEKGTYHVTAAFEVKQTPETAYAVLTDYEQVPTFMPDVRMSIVRERTPERILLEQEAVAKLMFFSKKVQLLLEVQETADTITFKDTSGKSFTRYEGRWTLAAREDLTEIRYTLTAKPSFSVPGFVLTRLLKRDASRMIDGLRGEMAKTRFANGGPGLHKPIDGVLRPLAIRRTTDNSNLTLRKAQPAARVGLPIRIEPVRWSRSGTHDLASSLGGLGVGTKLGTVGRPDCASKSPSCSS